MIAFVVIQGTKIIRGTIKNHMKLRFVHTAAESDIDQYTHKPKKCGLLSLMGVLGGVPLGNSFQLIDHTTSTFNLFPEIKRFWKKNLASGVHGLASVVKGALNV